jgi:hypothetical protein
MPEPILVSIAAALAGKSIVSLYDFVKHKLTGRTQALAALEAAAGATPESAEVHALSEELEQAERDDPQFAVELRAAWARITTTQHADHGAVSNQIIGNISGKVVQARDIEGGVSL